MSKSGLGDRITSSPDLLGRFKFESILNTGDNERYVCLLGEIDGKPAILSVTRLALDVEEQRIVEFATGLKNVKQLGSNSEYHWYTANALQTTQSVCDSDTIDFLIPDVKVDLIYPCSEDHVRKYSRQAYRWVRETKDTYIYNVRPFIEKVRTTGQLNWIEYIFEGLNEKENILYREHGEEGFLIIPDKLWDGKTIETLHLLLLVEREDIWTVRDLEPKHITWLENMGATFRRQCHDIYKVKEEQISLFIHYHPTYYHFHIHAVHISAEPGYIQAFGKAIGLDTLVTMLKLMAMVNTTPPMTMEDITLSYTVGESSQLWIEALSNRTQIE